MRFVGLILILGLCACGESADLPEVPREDEERPYTQREAPYEQAPPVRPQPQAPQAQTGLPQKVGAVTPPPACDSGVLGEELPKELWEFASRTRRASIVPGLCSRAIVR